MSVVAVVARHRKRTCLLKRSSRVSHDAGRWHCITGYIDAGRAPEQQALEELFEETGVTVADLASFQSGKTLQLEDDQGRVWTVHTYECEVTKRDVRLNWEHDDYRWVRPRTLPRFAPVPWLFDVLRAVGPVS